MLSAHKYAEKHGYKVATVLKWCRNGNLKNCQKSPTCFGYEYLIPEGEQPVKPLRKYQRLEEKMLAAQEKPEQTLEEPKRLEHLKTERQKAMHIKKHAIDRSFRRLCAETGLTHIEVRRIYDKLHERYGI